VALLQLHLINRPGEFLNEQSKVRYVFSWLEGAALEEVIHLVDNDYLNLKSFEVVITLLEEAYGVPDHMNTVQQVLSKLCQGNREFVVYHSALQCLITDLDWNDKVKGAALHHGLSEDLKDILST
jgi:hypothetical protein